MSQGRPASNVRTWPRCVRNAGPRRPRNRFTAAHGDLADAIQDALVQARKPGNGGKATVDPAFGQTNTESALARLLRPRYARGDDEGRALLREAFTVKDHPDPS